jgi:hypothetical protein
MPTPTQPGQLTGAGTRMVTKAASTHVLKGVLTSVSEHALLRSACTGRFVSYL